MEHSMDYLSEEDILKLIDEVEKEGLMEAPKELEGNILSEARRIKEEQVKCYKKQWNRQCLKLYFRVSMTMAAALAVVVLAPAKISYQEMFSLNFSNHTTSVVKEINAKTSKVSASLVDWTNQILSKEEIKIEKEEEK